MFNNRELLEQYIIVSVYELYVIHRKLLTSPTPHPAERVSVEDLHVIILLRHALT